MTVQNPRVFGETPAFLRFWAKRLMYLGAIKDLRIKLVVQNLTVSPEPTASPAPRKAGEKDLRSRRYLPKGQCG